MGSDQPAVLVRTEGAIQVITINRPQARNAINQEVALAMAAAFAELDDATTCTWASSPAPAATSAPAWT